MELLKYTQTVERWGSFEVSCLGYSDGNPFTDYQITGKFKSKNECVTVNGFYDGDGAYIVRFMPSFVESYSFEICGSFSNEKYRGNFEVIPADKNNHGPVRVSNTYHLAYEDGTPYFSVGTTCYVWNLQSDERMEQTMETLKNGAFNKIRFCIFPKHYDYNLSEPRSYPYEGTPCDSSKLTKDNFMEYSGDAEGNTWDFTRFQVEHFRHIEKCIQALMDLSIEADLIIMHPYDRWGFSQMDEKYDDLYWRYIIARFSAFRNIWWSLANEYDILKHKSTFDWERLAATICEQDPYNHLRSIHNCVHFYDYSRPWVTHCSIQRQELYKSAEYVNEWRERYKKPIILDEIGYEGNIQHAWGNLSGKELVRRFWEATCRGGYAGHGETYLCEDNILWWSHGGKLKGESPERLKFLHRILQQTPGCGLTPVEAGWDGIVATVADASQKNSYNLYYYSFMRPSFREFYFDKDNEYKVEVIDTWEMTIEDRGIYKGKFTVELPGKEYMAIRISQN